MAEGIEIGIDTTNFQILEDAFRKLSVQDQRTIMISAFKKATLPIVAMIKGNVATEAFGEGNLFRSIGTKALSDEAAIWVGSILKTPYVSKRGKLSTVWYGHITEGGASNVGRPPSGINRSMARRLHKSGELKGGTIQARHWFSSAWDAGQYEAYESIDQEMFGAIERFLNKETSRMK